MNGNELAIVGNELAMNGHEVAIVGNELAVNGNEVAIVGNELAVNGNDVTIDGDELAVNGKDVAIVDSELAVRGNGVTTHLRWPMPQDQGPLLRNPAYDSKSSNSRKSRFTFAITSLEGLSRRRRGRGCDRRNRSLGQLGLERARAVHDDDLRDGFGAVWIPKRSSARSAWRRKRGAGSGSFRRARAGKIRPVWSGVKTFMRACCSGP